MLMDFSGKNFTKTFTLPYYLAIGGGLVEKMDAIDKFWEAPGLQTTDVDVEVWEEGIKYTFSADGISDINTLSSDNTWDTNILVKVYGLDSEGNESIGYANLNGQNKVLIYSKTDLSGSAISFWRVYRLENVSGEVTGTTAKNIQGNVYCYVDTPIVSGIPTDKTKIRAKIVNWNNQTQMAIYTIPKGKVWYLIQGDVSMSRPQSNTTTSIVQYKSRRFGGVFKIKKTIGLVSTGTSYFKDIRSIPDIIPPLTDIVISAKSVSSNDTGISASFQIILVEDKRFN